jgi:cytoskeletal protein CcmA (bactofilin family)
MRFAAPAEAAGGGTHASDLASRFAPADIGPAIRVVGDLYAEQDLVLHGEISGAVDLPDHALSVAGGARLEGPAFARIVSITGTVVGDITASELVEVLPGAIVEGDITAPRIHLDEEARFRGRIEMKRVDAAVRVARYRLERKAADTKREP